MSDSSTHVPLADGVPFSYPSNSWPSWSIPVSSTTLWLLLAAVWYCSYLSLSRKPSKFPNIYGHYELNAPTVGYKNAVLGRLQFFLNGPALIREGYRKHKGSLFKLSGGDLLIVPTKYLAELASLPPEKLSLNVATAEAFQRLANITDVIVDHSLQARLLVTHLTPRLGAYVPLVQSKISKHLCRDIPAKSSEWTDLNALEISRRLVHRIVATQFVSDLADHEGFMKIAVGFSENGFKHNFLLRVLPDFTKNFVAPLLPTTRGVRRALHQAREMVIPIIRERRRQEKENPRYTAPDDFLQHLITGGVEIGDDDATTVQRLMVAYLGAGPSTIIALTQVLFDLCAHPEYVDPLRQEVLDVLQRRGFSKVALHEMKKMDSFMRESQRLNPPTLLGFNSVTQQEITLHDGTTLPKGTHVQMATYAAGTDPEHVDNANEFDGFRQYKLRQQPGEENKHQFTTTSETNLHFGHGRLVCPGHFFVDHSIKIIVANVLLRFDLRFAGGKTVRPSTTGLYDIEIPDLSTRVEFRKREDADLAIGSILM